MKTRSYLLLLPVLILFGAACQDRGEPIVSGPTSAAPEGEVLLNRESAPRERVFSFDAQGSLDGRWRGDVVYLATGDEGVLEVETTFAEVRGRTVHLVQTWRLFLPSLFESWGEPWSGGDPVRLALTGILNLTTGKLVLNGVVDDGEISPAHVRGEAVVGDGGTLMVGGELMFNPQPEPPAR